MKTKKKALLMTLCAVMLVVASVMGNMAYLTSTDEVVNTFTVGNVEIKLDEAKANTDGTLVDNGATRVQTNSYKLLPGHAYTKDPTVHVDANSEQCWLFVKVEDGLAAIEDTTTIADQMTAKGWTPIASGSNVYAYRTKVNAGENISVFDSFKIKGDAVVSGYANAQIVVTAYAVQADGFATATAAWEASGFGN